MMIAEEVGLPAVLEQTAEEAAELAHACLKLARFLRRENPTPVSEDEARRAVTEEYADVEVCASVLREAGVVDMADVCETVVRKRARWKSRLKQSREGTEAWEE